MCINEKIYIWLGSEKIFKLCYTYSQCQKHTDTLNGDQNYIIRETIEHF